MQPGSADNQGQQSLDWPAGLRQGFGLGGRVYWDSPISDSTLSQSGRNCDGRFGKRRFQGAGELLLCRKLWLALAEFVAAAGEFPLFVAESILPLGHSSFVTQQFVSQRAADVLLFEHRLPLSFEFRQL